MCGVARKCFLVQAKYHYAQCFKADADASFILLVHNLTEVMKSCRLITVQVHLRQVGIRACLRVVCTVAKCGDSFLCDQIIHVLPLW